MSYKSVVDIQLAAAAEIYVAHILWCGYCCDVGGLLSQCCL